MIQLRLLVLCVALSLSITSQNHLVAQEALQPPLGKAPVEVYLTATGKNSSSGALDQSALTVTLDKQPIQLTSIRSAKHDKLLFAVVVDASTSNARNSGWIKKAAFDLFEGLLANGNQGYLVSFDVSARRSASPLQLSEVRKVLVDLQFVGGTALFDTIAKTCTTVLSKSGNPNNPRRAIILISDGDDNQSHTQPKEAIQVAEKEGVSIFSLRTTVGGDTGEQILGDFTKKTGGRAVIDESRKEGVRALLSAIDSQWVLSFVPPSSSNRDLHSFAVKSSQKSIEISAPANIVIQSGAEGCSG